jgi:hypothetical protein
MCVPGDANSCRKAGACEWPLRFDGLRGRVNMVLGAQQVSIALLLRSIYTETVCEKCPGAACECDKEDCNCGTIGCARHFGVCGICESTICVNGCFHLHLDEAACHMCATRQCACCASDRLCDGQDSYDLSCDFCDVGVLCSGCVYSNSEEFDEIFPRCSVCNTWSCCKQGCASAVPL